MPDDANGNHSLPPQYFVQNGDTVLPVQHNPPFEDVSAGLTARVCKDGRTVMTGNLQMGGNKVSGMDDGTNPGDAVNKSQLDDKLAKDGSNVGGASAKASLVAAIGAGLRGHLYGLNVANNSTDAEHDLDVAVGEAASDDENPVLMRLTTGLTKQFDTTFAEGTGNGGMVTGESLPTSGTVHVWLIMKADGTVDVCANNDASSGLSPTLPTGFVYKRRVGSLRTDSSANILQFAQDADEFRLRTPVLDVNVNNPGASATDRALSVPAAIRPLCRIVVLSQSAGSTYRALKITPLDETTAEPSASAVPGLTMINRNSSGAAAFGVQEMLVRADSASRVRSRYDGSDTDLNLRIWTEGWFDTRGRLN